MNRLKVLIVDDHDLVRRGIANLLRSQGIEVIGEASSGLEAVEKARLLHPDIVLMDIRMPGGDGLQATQLIKSETPQTRVVMLTAFEDDEAIFKAMQYGAAGYLLKNVKAEELINLLSRVMNGEVVVSSLVASRIVQELFHNPERLRERDVKDEVTPREREVLKLVAGGATNKEIASALSISDNTVKYHMRNIMDKLQVRNRAQMAAYGATGGMSASLSDSLAESGGSRPGNPLL